MKTRNIIEGLDFSDVIRGVKAGGRFRRKGWKLESYAFLSEVDKSLWIVFNDGLKVAWLPSHTEIMAEDWEMVE